MLRKGIKRQINKVSSFEKNKDSYNRSVGTHYLFCMHFTFKRFSQQKNLLREWTFTDEMTNLYNFQ